MPAEVVSPVLVGRAGELARLRAAVDRTSAGNPGVVLVGGEAGVGKTRLLEEAFERAADGQIRLLTGACIDLGGDGFPFAPVVEALRSLLRTTSPADLDRLLGPARRELSRLLPELAEDGRLPSGTGNTAQLFELVLGVLGRLGEEHPLVFAVEDLHWADRSTMDFVAFLVRALRGVRVLLVLTYRTDEVDRRSALRPVLSAWERLRGVERLHLDRFDRSEVAAQVGGILGTEPEPALVDLVFDRSEGNAFFVEELVRILSDGASPDELPPSLRDVLLTRAERLSSPAQRVLRTAAVAGRWVPERLLARVAALADDELFQALREVIDASLLVVHGTGRGYAFRHALTRDAVYADLLPGERVQLHTAYAAILAEEPGLAADDASVAATLAAHWYAAYDLPRALAASVQAGREAIAAFAPAEARRHLERALEVWHSVPDAEARAGADQIDVLTLAARASLSNGEPERALTLLTQALALVDADVDPDRAALIVEQRAMAHRMLGGDAEGLQELEHALAALPRDRPSLARAAVLCSLANALMRLVDERGPAVGREAIAAARAVGARTQEADALISTGTTLTYLEDPAEGEAALRQGLRLALDIGEHQTALRGYVNLSDTLEAWGRHREAADVAREGIALAARLGLSRGLGALLAGNLMEPLVRLGRWAEADRLARESMALGLTGIFAASLHDMLGYMAAASGRYDDAQAHVVDARRQLRDSREPQYTQALTYIEAEVSRARGDLDRAAALTAAGLSETTPGWSGRYAWPLAWLACRTAADRSLLARDRDRQAERIDGRPIIDAILAVQSASPAPAALAYRALSEAELLRGDGEPAESAWRSAVEAWERAGQAWPLAYARYRLAEALCAAGRGAEAIAPLHEALRVAAELGARPLQDEAGALARRARLDVTSGQGFPADIEEALAPAAESPAPFGLTDREREVLALVAAGHSNSQIARTLYISPKTASVHVSNILAKLRVGGRVEAAAVAVRWGLADPAGSAGR